MAVHLTKTTLCILIYHQYNAIDSGPPTQFLLVDFDVIINQNSLLGGLCLINMRSWVMDISRFFESLKTMMLRRTISSISMNIRERMKTNCHLDWPWSIAIVNCWPFERTYQLTFNDYKWLHHQAAHDCFITDICFRTSSVVKFMDLVKNIYFQGHIVLNKQNNMNATSINRLIRTNLILEQTA